MKSDPVVDEVREIRDGIAREYNYDIRAIVEGLIAKQLQRDQRVASAGEPSEAPNKGMDPTS